MKEDRKYFPDDAEMDILGHWFKINKDKSITVEARINMYIGKVQYTTVRKIRVFDYDEYEEV